MKKPRRYEALPEDANYYFTPAADGCSVSPTCFECPLRMCRYEAPGGLRQLLNESRDRKIQALRGKLHPDEIAAKFGVGRRTVFRVWAI